jgi:O-antigen/teichoic acid export membrane protein
MRYISVIEALANLVLNWCLIKLLGLMGVIFASMISYFIFNFIGGAVILYRCYYTKAKISEYFIKHGVYLLVTVVIGAATFLIVSFIGMDGIPGFIVKTLVSTAVPGILYTAAYIWTDDRKKAEPLIRKILKGKRVSNE